MVIQDVGISQVWAVLDLHEHFSLGLGINKLKPHNS